MNATQTLPRSSLTRAQRRQIAKAEARTARLRLLEAAKRLDDDLPTAYQNALAAITAVDDLVDAIESTEKADRDFDAELRQWGIDHNENADELAAEAKGEC